MRMFSHFHEPNYHIFLKIKFVRVLLRKKKTRGVHHAPSMIDPALEPSASCITQIVFRRKFESICMPNLLDKFRHETFFSK